MNKSKAEAIIGSDVSVAKKPIGKFIRVWCTDAFGQVLMETARNLPAALALLIRSNYARSRKFVLERDHYRCTNCGAFNALHADHRTSRAKGRDDRPENLVTLCAPCHKIRHEAKGFYA